jgi:GT2 family glycosyltransferase
LSVTSSIHVLQKVRDGVASNLNGPAKPYPGRNGIIVGVDGQALIFDGIFGAFFDGYWVRHTAVSELFLDFRLCGQVRVTIDRIASSGGEKTRVVEVECSGSDERVTIPVPLIAWDETRLVLSVEFITASKILDPVWATRTQPVRPVHLTTVICTFNRDEDLAATVNELLADSSLPLRIVVVNQGEPDLPGRNAARWPEVQSPILTVIDQPNLGGAGGFGRGVLETLADDRSTHVLLMDDDIELCSDIVLRLIAVLGYVKHDYAIGGAMLDRSNRTNLFSVGDVLSTTTPEIRNLVDPAASNIAQEATSRYLARYHQPDFNGWWFFAFSKVAVEQVGLPLPLFIRGDDVEYGYRLSLEGIKTLSWPGIAVWHDPFHLKRHPWHYFYDRRNSLYLCEMHGRFGKGRIVRFLTVSFLNHLLRFDYERATCSTLGLQAFNDGVGALQRWNGKDHTRLASDHASREYRVGYVDQHAAVQTSRLPSFLLFLGRLALDLLRSSPALADRTTIRSRDWKPTVRHRPRHVRVHYTDSGTIADYGHDRARARACAKAFTKQALRFLVRRRRPDHLLELTRPTFWLSYTNPAS